MGAGENRRIACEKFSAAGALAPPGERERRSRKDKHTAERCCARSKIIVCIDRFSPPPVLRGSEDDPGSVGTSSSADDAFASFLAVTGSC